MEITFLILGLVFGITGFVTGTQALAQTQKLKTQLKEKGILD